MTVGFTGTRKGMNNRQIDQLAVMLEALRDPRSYQDGGSQTPFHFGGAPGADLRARKMAKALSYGIEWHPSPGVDLATLVHNGYADAEELLAETWHEVFPPLVRNHHIVDAIQVLLAAPHTDVEERRSGTWATIRYARQVGRPVCMLSRGE